MIKSFNGCMDHSIGEQLTGDPSSWHTTVIAISESAADISELARSIAACLPSQNQKLVKWNKVRGTKQYWRDFARCLGDKIASQSVYIFSNSTQESVIDSNISLILRELNLDPIYKAYERSDGKRRVQIGPVICSLDRKEQFIDIPENQALMLSWVAHFMLRCHRLVYDQLRVTNPELYCVDWLFYVDKMAGGTRSAKFFNFVIQHNLREHPVSQGNIRLSFFDQGDTVETDLLADNISGLINNVMNGNMPDDALASLVSSSQFHCESGRDLVFSAQAN